VSTPAPAACVIGWPIGHSRSPLIQNYWLQHYKLPGAYRSEAVPPDEFKAFVQSLPAHGYVGANVTVPHKEAALACSNPDDCARAVGAANTLWLDAQGQLRSTNTDVEGFLGNLDACVPTWTCEVKKAVVLGSGGAARAVVYALIERGIADIAVINRSRERAEALRQRLGGNIRVLPWDERNDALADAGLLINTTVLGMHGQPELALAVDRLPAHAIVSDLVYVPLITPLLAAAKARRLRTADGLGMLMHQAVRGFALWSGQTPEVTAELRALLEADIAV
jgi:shikimate dehydrogenase